MFDEKEFCEKIKQVQPGEHDLQLCELIALEKHFNTSVFDLITAAFKLGFMKGQEVISY